MTTTEIIWLSIGFFGQGLFFMRWVVQWLASERTAQSHVPIAFWYISLLGGLITLAYAIYRKDPVFIAGQGVGTFVYLRNLMLIYRREEHTPSAFPPPSARSKEVRGAKGVQGYD
ncbi:MAG: lipid-A-disaccharide synthase N-terminal domain-containing protein [Nitrospiraceae bacterium]